MMLFSGTFPRFVIVLASLCGAMLVARGAPASSPLQVLLDDSVRDVLAEFKTAKLQPNELATTLVDLRVPAKALRASVRGDELIYPASVVKLFYLVAAHRWMEENPALDTPELRRAMKDMIVDSSNDATSYVVDVLTGTTSGPELPLDEMKTWYDRRNAVNRYFAELGFDKINVNKKPWGDGPYGREMQAAALYEPRRNFLTTDATARLLMKIALEQSVTPARSRQMLELLHRDPTKLRTDPDDQAGFTGPALPAGAKLWSKAGWTSETRHDAAIVQLPDGSRFILVVFTVNHAKEHGIISALAKKVIAGFPATAPK